MCTGIYKEEEYVNLTISMELKCYIWYSYMTLSRNVNKLYKKLNCIKKSVVFGCKLLN